MFVVKLLICYFLFCVLIFGDVLFEGKVLGRNCCEQTGSRSFGFIDCSFTTARCTGEGKNGREGVLVHERSAIATLIVSLWVCLSVRIFKMLLQQFLSE